MKIENESEVTHTESEATNPPVSETVGTDAITFGGKASRCPHRDSMPPLATADYDALRKDMEGALPQLPAGGDSTVHQGE